MAEASQIESVNSPPFVSVVITGKNASDTIAECLESVLNVRYPAFEVIYVDGESDDETMTIVSKIAERSPNLKVLIKEGPPSSGRNAGISFARGDIIAFTDADCRVDQNWLLTLVKNFKHNPVVGVGGPTFTPKNDPYLARCIGWLFSTLFGTGGTRHPSVYPDARYVHHNPACNAAFGREIFQEAGFFDESLAMAEDLEFDCRVQRMGYKLVYAPDAVVWHHRRGTIRCFAKQMFDYGFWRAKAGRRVHKLLGVVYLMPSLFVLGLILGAVGLFFGLPFLSNAYSLGLMAYLTFGLVSGFLVVVRARDIKLMLMVPLLGFIEHVSYGLGFLKGLIVL